MNIVTPKKTAETKKFEPKAPVFNASPRDVQTVLSEMGIASHETEIPLDLQPRIKEAYEIAEKVFGGVPHPVQYGIYIAALTWKLDKLEAKRRIEKTPKKAEK